MQTVMGLVMPDGDSYNMLLGFHCYVIIVFDAAQYRSVFCVVGES